MKTNRKLVTWIGIILAVGVAGAAGWYFLIRPSASLSKSLPAAWNSLVNPAAATVSTGVLNASGTVETTVLSIAPELSGKILEVDYQEGDLVKAGSVLVHLDDSTLKIQRDIAAANLEAAKLALQQLTTPTVIANLQKTIAQDEQDILDAQQALDIQKYFTNNTESIQDAQAKLEVAKVNMDKAQTAYDKIKYLNFIDESVKAAAYERLYFFIQQYNNAQALVDIYTGVPNQEQVDLKTATLALATDRLTEDQALLDALTGGSIPDNATGAGITNLRQAKINVQLAQAKLDLLNDQISKMTITAPADGVVMTRSADPGNVVNPGTELLSLARLNDLTITVYIPEDSYGNIKMGQTATVTADAFPGETFNARVVHISNQPQYLTRTTTSLPSDQLTVYAIQLQLNDITGKLKPGMPADVSFSIK